MIEKIIIALVILLAFLFSGGNVEESIMIESSAGQQDGVLNSPLPTSLPPAYPPPGYLPIPTLPPAYPPPQPQPSPTPPFTAVIGSVVPVEGSVPVPVELVTVEPVLVPVEPVPIKP